MKQPNNNPFPFGCKSKEGRSLKNSVPFKPIYHSCRARQLSNTEFLVCQDELEILFAHLLKFIVLDSED